jgi:hypothetical protein
MKPIFNIKFNVTAKFYKAAKKKNKKRKKKKKGKIILSTFLHVPSI